MSETKSMGSEPHAQVDQILEHDFDGIQEYDNRLPNWWLWILYASIIFSFAYWLFFHTFGVGKLSEARYEAEMIAAAEAALAAGGDEITDEGLTLAASIPERVSSGRQLYSQHCVACHASQGEGIVGPNLTDAYWIHGGNPTDIHKVIMNGVVAKGMAAWGRQLGPARVEALVAYVLSIKNSNVPGKAPEGELFESP